MQTTGAKSVLRDQIIKQAYSHSSVNLTLMKAPTNCPNCNSEYTVKIGYDDLLGHRYVCQFCGQAYHDQNRREIAA